MIGHNFLFDSHTSKAARASFDYRSPSGAATVTRSAQVTPSERPQTTTARHAIQYPHSTGAALSLHLYEPLRHSQYSRHHHVDVPAATQGLFNTNVHVSEDMRRQYMEFAEGSIRKVFTLSDCHKNSWIPKREQKGVAIYRNFDQMCGPKAYKSNVAEMGCKGQLSASLDQVGRAYAAHDDALFKRLMKKLIPVVMDAAVLLTIAPLTSITPFRYIGAVRHFMTQNQSISTVSNNGKSVSLATFFTSSRAASSNSIPPFNLLRLQMSSPVYGASPYLHQPSRRAESPQPDLQASAPPAESDAPPVKHECNDFFFLISFATRRLF